MSSPNYTSFFYKFGDDLLQEVKEILFFLHFSFSLSSQFLPLNTAPPNTKLLPPHVPNNLHSLSSNICHDILAHIFSFLLLATASFFSFLLHTLPFPLSWISELGLDFMNLMTYYLVGEGLDFKNTFNCKDLDYCLCIAGFALILLH